MYFFLAMQMGKKENCGILPPAKSFSQHLIFNEDSSQKGKVHTKFLENLVQVAYEGRVTSIHTLRKRYLMLKLMLIKAK